jgi:hypothetical protein
MAPGVVSQPASAKDDAHVAVVFPPLGEDPGVNRNGEALKGPRPIVPDDEYEKLRLAGHLPWKTHFYDAQVSFDSSVPLAYLRELSLWVVLQVQSGQSEE